MMYRFSGGHAKFFCSLFSSNGRFLRNLANFSFQASGMRVTELLVNSAQLSVNSAELSVNMAEFWFFKKSLFLSLTQWILAEF
jgi:hypothetical protein